MRLSASVLIGLLYTVIQSVLFTCGAPISNVASGQAGASDVTLDALDDSPSNPQTTSQTMWQRLGAHTAAFDERWNAMTEHNTKLVKNLFDTPDWLNNVRAHVHEQTEAAKIHLLRSLIEPVKWIMGSNKAYKEGQAEVTGKTASTGAQAPSATTTGSTAGNAATRA